MTELEIKATVRERDGYACTLCGMTESEHLDQWGKTLDVHRVTPGSPYAVDQSCVTVCRSCHGPQPRRRQGDRGTVNITLERDEWWALKAAAVLKGLSTTKYARDVLLKDPTVKAMLERILQQKALR